MLPVVAHYIECQQLLLAMLWWSLAVWMGFSMISSAQSVLHDQFLCCVACTTHSKFPKFQGLLAGILSDPSQQQQLIVLSQICMHFRDLPHRLCCLKWRLLKARTTLSASKPGLQASNQACAYLLLDLTYLGSLFKLCC